MVFWVKMAKKERGLKPVLLKLGAALALSFAGFLVSHFRKKRINSNPSPPSPNSSSASDDRKTVSGSTPATPNSGDASSFLRDSNKETPRQKSALDAHSVVGASSTKDSGGEAESNNLILDEFDAHSATNMSPRKSVDRSPAMKTAVEKETEREIYSLKNKVRTLQDKERKLELQLLEYYGLKEQETAVMELQNRLKINSVEAKLFTLRIESLQADKKRLEAQVADRSKVVGELEAARSKVRMLKRKNRLVEEHFKEKLSHLQNKVAELQGQEDKSEAENLDIERRLQRLKELEGEATELRLANSRLEYENAELKRRVESSKLLATSVLELPEGEALQEENKQLRLQHEDLTKEIEQLQASHCTDVEELVYLRWVNACLRYELRNFKAPNGKTGARDLSKSLSPTSEEKAKQLILEYANSEGNGDKAVADFDSEYWSSSQGSSLTSSLDLDDSSIDVSYSNKPHGSKSKFFKKLRKLIHGKDSSKHNSTPDRCALTYNTPGRRDTMSTSSYEIPRTSSGSPCSSHQNSCMSPMDSVDSRVEGRKNKPILRSKSFSRPPLDNQRLRTPTLSNIKETEGKQRSSDVGSPGTYFYKRMNDSGSVSGLSKDSQSPSRSEQDLETEKLELIKFAEALKGSSASASPLSSLKGLEGNRRSDVGSPGSYFYRSTPSKDSGSVSGLSKDSQSEQDLESEKLELIEFAVSLKGSSDSPNTSGRSPYSSY